MATFFTGRAYIDGAFRVVLGKAGPKWTCVVCFVDGGKLAVRRERGEIPVREIPGETAKTIARKFRRRPKGRMTKGARAIIEEALA